MLDTIIFIVNWAVSFVYGTLLFLITRQFLPLRRKHLLLEILEICLIFTLSNIIIYPGETTGTIGSFFALLIVLMIFHRSSLFLKCSAAVLIFPVMTAISYILQDIGSLIWLYGFQTNMSLAWQDILHAFTMILRIPVWYVIYRCVKRWIPHAVHNLTRRMWILLDLVSVASFIGIITVIYKSTSATSYMAYPACIASLVTNMGCCYLCTYMANTIRTEMELETYQYQQAYYQEMEAGQQAIRRMRHDMKNHLNIVGSFLQNQGYDEAIRYLSELNQEFVPSTKAYCPNSTVNAVLNVKEQAAKSCGIRCDLQVDLLESPEIDNVDLCSLFSNTLDNAIEASEKLPEEQRLITIRAELVREMLVILVENNALSGEMSSGVTTKKDAFLHGFGVANIRKAVEKYGGECVITCKPGGQKHIASTVRQDNDGDLMAVGRFCLKIILPLPGHT